MDGNMEDSMNDSSADDDACCRGHVEKQTDAGVEGVPQIFPPPDGLHSSCDTCEENYYTVQAQKKAISLHRPVDTFCAVYGGPYTDTKAQNMMDYAIEQTTKALEQIKEDLTLYGDLILARWTKKTKDKRGGLFLSQRSNISKDYSKQGNRLENALRKLSVWMSVYDHRSGRGALRRMLTELFRVRPDSRVNDSISTIALLGAMRLIWLSGHVIPSEDLKSGPDREKAALKRIDHMKNVHGQAQLAAIQKTVPLVCFLSLMGRLRQTKTLTIIKGKKAHPAMTISLWTAP
jgi:hypothetical protein